MRSTDDFLEILDGFYDQLTDAGALLFVGCYEATCDAAKRIMQSTDLHYVPGHKVTELMADLVNIAAAISCEGWLNDDQARSNFDELTSSTSPVARTFQAEALMEKARYEPIMLTDRHTSPLSERNSILQLRLARMLSARQYYDPLPMSYIRAITDAAHHATLAECFATYRPGPMLQYFDDMIRLADQINDQTFDEPQGLIALHEVLREGGRLWKLYKHKAPRFRAPDGDPLRENRFPVTRATMLFVPDKIGRPTLH